MKKQLLTLALLLFTIHSNATDSNNEECANDAAVNALLYHAMGLSNDMNVPIMKNRTYAILENEFISNDSIKSRRVILLTTYNPNNNKDKNKITEKYEFIIKYRVTASGCQIDNINKDDINKITGKYLN